MSSSDTRTVTRTAFHTIGSDGTLTKWSGETIGYHGVEAAINSAVEALRSHGARHEVIAINGHIDPRGGTFIELTGGGMVATITEEAW
jgi:hypothetical protein